MRQNKNHRLFGELLIFLIAAGVLLCACGSYGRTGIGPYDVTDYSALDAQQDLREFHMEQTQDARYGDPYDSYRDRDIEWTDICDPSEEYSDMP